MQDANVQHIIADLRSVDLLDCAGLAAPVGSNNRLRTRGGSFTLVASSCRTLQPSTSPRRGSRGSDGVQHLSPVDQRVCGLQEVRETVELLETGIGVMLAMRGMTWHLDRDDVLGYVRAIKPVPNATLGIRALRNTPRALYSRQLRPLILTQRPAPIAAAPLVGIHSVAQGARVDPQIPGDLRDRLTGLPDQPDPALPEISVEPPACLCHRRSPLSLDPPHE